MRVVLRDASSQSWLEFSSLRRIVTTTRLADVLPLVRQVEASVQCEGLYAAGFISYEAAPAFDPSLVVRTDDGFPLLWFGLFERIDEIELPVGDGFTAGTAIDWQASITRGDYDRCLRAIRNQILEGNTYQVNFTYRLQAATGVDPWRLFVHLAGDGRAPFAGFVDTGEWAVCSASPELFLRLDGDRIVSRPMKGTAARGLWCEQDRAAKEALVQSPKERAENLMIVDMARNDLGRVADPGSVSVPALLAVEKYPTVWQLTSTVAARTRASLAQILQATYPAASITGTPKRRTMDMIAALEMSPRRIYTGTLGFVLPHRQVQLNVAIRTVLIHVPTQRAEYGVGGGVVWDSTPQGEFEESRVKARTLTLSRCAFDLLETMLWKPREGFALLERHLARLFGSADYFDFRMDPQTVRSALTHAATEWAPVPHRVRLCVSRLGHVACEAVPLPTAFQNFGTVVWAKDPIDKTSALLYHKTTCRTVYDDRLKACVGADDAVLFNEDGAVTETTKANIAVEMDGVLYTPPVSCGLLPGTLRAEWLANGWLRERVLTIRDVLDSPRVCLLNSVRGLCEVHILPARAEPALR